MIAGDAGGTVGVEPLGEVAQPQYEPAVAVLETHPQHGVLREVAVHPRGIEDGLERRFGQAQFMPQRADARGRHVLVCPQVGGGPVSVAQQFPPGGGHGGEPARPGTAVVGDVPGGDLLLCGQGREDLGVRGQQQRTERDRQFDG